MNTGKLDLLAQAGRGVLIKSVAKSIPIYSMSSFLLRKTLCNRLDAISSKFWWNAMEDENSLYLSSWNKLARSKKDRGLGFRNIYDINLALLSKLFWKVLKDKISLWSRTMLSSYKKYFNLTNNTKLPFGGSPMMKGILKSKFIILEGALWNIGNGRSCEILERPVDPYK